MANAFSRVAAALAVEEAATAAEQRDIDDRAALSRALFVQRRQCEQKNQVSGRERQRLPDAASSKIPRHKRASS